MFASPVGVLEDPATGSASGALGAYLVKHGVVDVGPTTEIICEQGYAIDCPSRLTVHVHSDEGEIQYATVGGRAGRGIEGCGTFGTEAGRGRAPARPRGSS